MEISELADLIPLYVTGRASNDQRAAIERELPNSKELRDEIAFWRTARVASQEDAGYLAAGHLTSERVVDYARGAISSPVEKTEIEGHLQGCKRCSNDLESIRPAFAKPAPAPFQRTIKGLITRFVTEASERKGLMAVLRPIYALPLMAVLIVSGVIMYQLAIPPAHPVSFDLQFQTQDRSLSAGDLQTLRLSQGVSTVHLSIPIPRANLRPRREDVTLTLFPPAGNSIQLSDGFSWSGGTVFDTARVAVATSALTAGGVYSLHAAITYVPTSAPFEYSYRFNVVHEE